MKQDIHKWRMAQILRRIEEHNERRRKLILSGQAQTHPEWFADWEADELGKRKTFERLMLNLSVSTGSTYHQPD